MHAISKYTSSVQLVSIKRALKESTFMGNVFNPEKPLWPFGLFLLAIHHSHVPPLTSDLTTRPSRLNPTYRLHLSRKQGQVSSKRKEKVTLDISFKLPPLFERHHLFFKWRVHLTPTTWPLSAQFQSKHKKAEKNPKSNSTFQNSILGQAISLICLKHINLYGKFPLIKKPSSLLSSSPSSNVRPHITCARSSRGRP